MAVHNGPVHRDFFAGPNPEQIADLHAVHRDIDLGVIADNTGGEGSQAHELAHGRRGFTARAGFEETAQQDEGDNHGRGIKVDVMAHTQALKRAG